MAGSAQNGHTLPKSDLSRRFKRKDKQIPPTSPQIALRGHFCLPHQPQGNHVQVKDKISTRDTSALGQAQHQRNPQVDPKQFIPGRRREINPPRPRLQNPRPLFQADPLARNPAQLHRRTHRALPAKPRLLDYAPRYLLHISQTLLSRRPQQCHPRRTPVRLFHPHPLRYQLHRYPTSLPRRHRHCHPHPQPHARRTYPFRRQSPLLRLSSLHPLINEFGICRRPQPAVQPNCCPIIGSQDWCYGFKQLENPANAPTTHRHNFPFLQPKITRPRSIFSWK